MTTTTNDLLTFSTFAPTPTQHAFLQSPTRYKLFGGAMGGGKSTTLSFHIQKCMIKWPRSRWVLARYRGKDLKKTTLPIFMELLPNELIKSYNKTDGLLTLKNMSECIFTDLEDPNKLKSLNLSGFAVEEATDVPDDRAWNMLVTRLRKVIPGVKYFGLATCNPEPGWVKEKWVTDMQDGYRFFPALPSDNKYLPPNYITDTIAALNKSPALIERYLNGSWDAFDEIIFRPEWVIPETPSKELEFLCKVTFIDPAVSEKTSADETAIVTIGVQEITGKVYELEAIHGRWTKDEIIQQARAVWMRHRADLFCVETTGAQDWLRQDLLKEDIPAISYKPDIDKVRKAISIQHFFEDGRMRINSRDLQRQLIEFPKGVHDDIADALISALVCLKRYSMDVLPDNRSKFFYQNKQKTWQEIAQGMNAPDLNAALRRVMTGQ